MLLVYGSYSHPLNETSVVIDANVTRGPFGQRIGSKWTWTVEGRLSGTSQAEIDAAVLALEVAHQSDGGNLALYKDSGATDPTAHVRNSNETLGGVKVAKLSYPNGKGAEYSGWRTYQVIYEYDILSSLGGLDSWSETVEVSGGGPRFEWVETLDGPPVKVVACRQTTYRGAQSGSAVGIGAYPQFPQPNWPDAEHVDRRKRNRGSPAYDAGGQSRFPISWSYEFESDQPLGEPLPRLPG